MNGPFFLGEWRVEPDLDRISRDGADLTLRPQVMDLLVYFSQRPGELVTSEEILETIWAGRVTTQASVYNCVMELRHALGDDVHKPEFIETIPKRGYRLLASVSAAGEPAVAAAGERPSRRPPLALASLAAVVLAGLVFMRLDPPAADRAVEPLLPAIPERSIAVLPFKDRDPSQDQQYFADGLSEEILSQLGGVPGVKVSAGSSSFRFRDSREDLAAIAEQLGVNYILQGSISKSSDQLRVTARLTEARTGFIVWSDEFQRYPKAVWEVERAIGSGIADALSIATLPGAAEHGYAATEVEPDLYDRYLQALSLTRRRDRESLVDAIALLQWVVNEDSSFHRAAVLLIDSKLMLRWTYGETWGHPASDYRAWPDRLKPRLLASIRQIIEQEPGLAEAQLVLGKLLRVNRGHVWEAEAALIRALELNPSLAEAHRNLAWIQNSKAESMRVVANSFRRAAELDPLSDKAWLNLAMVLSNIPDARDEGWSVFRRVKASVPWSPYLSEYEARLLLAEGRYADAVVVLEDSLDREATSEARRMLSEIWEDLGEPERAAAVTAAGETWRDVAQLQEVIARNNRCLPAPEYAPWFDGVWNAWNCSQDRNWQPVIDILGREAPSLHELHLRYTGFIGQVHSPALLLALAYKNIGDLDESARYAALEQAAVDGRTENGQIRGHYHARLTARLSALRGEVQRALEELDAMLDFGLLDAGEFEHPVYDDIRRLPRFRQVESRRIGLVNIEREKLGLEPLPDSTLG